MTVYLLGPGVGESVVFVLPDGAAIVVDACVHDGTTLPVALLQHLGITKVELFVLSHPDLDHVRGTVDVLAKLSPREIWCYPLSNSVRDVFVDYCRSRKRKKYVDLADSLEALDRYQALTGRVMETNYGRALRRGPATVSALAPTHFDAGRLRRVWFRMLRARGGPDRHFERILAGLSRLGDAPNVLSLALVASFGGIRLLLGGDVMNGCKSPFSGWKGILRLLREEPDDASGLITDVAVVKVAHHGSRHSFEPAVWALHAKSIRPVSLVAPYSPSGLPHADTLKALSTSASHLLVSASPHDLQTRIASAGWVSSTSATVLAATSAPCVVVEVAPDFSMALHASKAAGAYEPGP